MIWELPALTMLLAYLLGSIPFGIVLTRLAGAGDLRQIGSGNIGATNVLRTGRKGLAAATLQTHDAQHSEENSTLATSSAKNLRM